MFPLSELLTRLPLLFSPTALVESCVKEDFLWDCKQLGAYSPLVLLNTLLFFCCKHFGFTGVEHQRQLRFTNITSCTRTNPDQSKTDVLRFYPLLSRESGVDRGPWTVCR